VRSRTAREDDIEAQAINGKKRDSAILIFKMVFEDNFWALGINEREVKGISCFSSLYSASY
jgi:hypothetical protein